MDQRTGLDEPSALCLRRRYPVSAEKVWRAWTDPQALIRWFGPGEPDSVTVAEVDLRVGGRYHIVFHTPDGEDHDVGGVYQEVVPHRRLVFSWAWRSTPERVSRVTLELEPQHDGGCELLFTHDRFFDAAARTNHERGWRPTFDKLDTFLAA
jgi:uncharacterized protein YndB with AHSA1/START domain